MFLVNVLCKCVSFMSVLGVDITEFCVLVIVSFDIMILKLGVLVMSVLGMLVLETESSDWLTDVTKSSDWIWGCDNIYFSELNPFMEAPVGSVPVENPCVWTNTFQADLQTYRLPV